MNEPTSNDGRLPIPETPPLEPVDDTTPKKRRGFLRFPRSWAEVKKLGWKFIVAFILFYLVRDVILYIIIPYLIYKGVIGK